MLDLVLCQLPNPALTNQMYSSLGILSIAAVVEREGYSIEIADLRNDYKPLPKAKFYGFSCTTPEINYAKELAKRVDQKNTRSSQSNLIAAWQAKVFHRDKLTCRICYREADALIQSNIDLHAHHILSWPSYPEVRFEVNNGLTLCDECHYCYHHADKNNSYEFIKQVFEFRTLAEQLTIETLAILHEKLAAVLPHKRKKKLYKRNYTKEKEPPPWRNTQNS